MASRKNPSSPLRFEQFILLEGFMASAAREFMARKIRFKKTEVVTGSIRSSIG
jgi:hypothetical protein